MVHHQRMWSPSSTWPSRLLPSSEKLLRCSLLSSVRSSRRTFLHSTPISNTNHVSYANMLLSGLYTLYLCLAFISCIPTKAHPAPRNEKSSKQSDIESPGSSFTEEKWEMEMNRLPRTPGTSGGMKSPMTPRTMAFKTLDGSMSPRRIPNKDLPLRHHIAMGDETWGSKKR